MSQMTEFIYKLKSNFISTLPYNNSIYKAKAADGLQLYRQISIDDLKQDAETISNRVDGFTTTIDKNNLLNSSCTCNDADFCQHQFALVFFLYAQYEPLTTLFEEWRSAEAENLFIQQKKRSSLSNHYSFKAWIDQLDTAYEQFSQAQSTKNLSIFQNLYDEFFISLPKIAPAEPTLRNLFLLYGGLYAILQFNNELKHIQLSANTKESFLYVHLYKLTNKVSELAKIKVLSSIPPTTKTLIESSLPFIRLLLDESDSLQYELMKLYEVVWANVLNDEEWIGKELRALESVTSVHTAIARSYLLFLKKKDEEAISALKPDDLAKLPYFISWIKELLSQKDTKRLSIWINYLSAMMGEYVRTVPSTYQGSRNMVSILVNLFKQYALLIKEEGPYIKCLQLLLPYSFIEYSQYLHNKGHLKEWMELQVLLDFDDAEQASEIAEYVIQQRADYAIPILHQIIRHFILERKKTSYALACDYLLKLKEIYIKISKEELFHRYMHYLHGETKSLSLFQKLLKERGLHADV